MKSKMATKNGKKKKRGGMAKGGMKTKGMAKGGMKSKGYARGGVVNPSYGEVMPKAGPN